MGISLTTVFTSIILFLVVTGFLFGLIKGMARSIFSLILVVACLVFVFVFDHKLASLVMHLDVGGQTLKEALTSALSQTEGMGALVEKLVPLIEILIGVIGFIIVFIASYFISRVIYFIGKFFIRPTRKMRLLGGLFGIVQGLVIAFAICVPVNGLLLEINKFTEIEIQGEQVFNLDSLQMKEYEESTINKLLVGVGDGFFKELASTTTEDGKTLTLSGQVESIVSVVKIANHVSKIPEINFEDGLTTDTVKDVADILRNIEDIKQDTSEEALETIDSLIQTAVEVFEVQIDIPELSIKDVNFENEAVIVEAIYEITENESLEGVENLDEVVEAFANSKLVLPIAEMALENSEINLPEDVKDDLETAIDKLEDPEQIQKLKELFGIIPTA
ncbi:MAG: CvpA family protein [Clostridia bacterium]|nr:CvpA family protein [Clostridia bacterium]